MSAEASSEFEARQLVFVEGGSNKFWNIERSGVSHTVTYGRVGSTGSTQTKEFGSATEAQKSFAKLVAEKIKKGYVDSATEPTAEYKSSDTKSSDTKSSDTKSSDTKSTKSVPKSSRAQAKASSENQAAISADVSSPVTGRGDFSVTRSIALKPAEWFRAGARRLAPLERGSAKAFDHQKCVARLAKLRATTYGYDVRWSDLRLEPALSRMEAHFWLLAMGTSHQYGTKMSEFAELIAKEPLTGAPSTREVAELFTKYNRALPQELLIPLSNLFEPIEMLEILVDWRMIDQRQHFLLSTCRALLQGFREFCVPYLSEVQRETLREALRRNWDPTQEPQGNGGMFPFEYYFAAAIGMPQEVQQVVSRWSEDRYSTSSYLQYYEHPEDLVFGLATVEQVEAEWRRLRLQINNAEQAIGFLAATEYVALDLLADAAIKQTNKDNCKEIVDTLALVHAPEGAEPMLRCKLFAKVPSVAREWLDQNVGCAVAGLVQTASGSGALAEGAIDYLRNVKRNGHQELIQAALETAGAKTEFARVQTEVLDWEEKVFVPFDERSTPVWLADQLKTLGKLKRKTLPSWAQPAVLPPFVVGDHRLNNEQVELLLQVLISTSLGEKHPLLLAMRAEISKSSRDAFTWSLFEAWQLDGFPSKDKWAMGAIGHLGDDGCVFKLTPLIRNWPGESQHARAVFGLECLRAIGSSSALMQLAGIAQKLKFKGLKAKAEQYVSEIATERGLTRDELEDRVVPDCGLDEQGRRTFSFGSRSFAFVLASDLKAMVRDDAGKVRPNLPDPNSKDDQELANESVAEWKLLKKQIKEVATIQAGRLEQAMVTGRRWSLEDFESLMVKHPLMTHLAQKLIWGGFSRDGERRATFRVTEERDYADVDDGTADLDTVEFVGIVHPLELSVEERSRWGEVLGDYEVVPPFPQLGRDVHLLKPEEGGLDDLPRAHGLELLAPTLVFTLEKLGWLRGTAMDGGCFDEHSKPFPAAQVTAVIGYDGTVGMGYIDPNVTLKVTSLHFCAGLRAPSGYGWGSEKKLKLQQVPQVVMSEVLADVQVLKSKSK